MRRLALSLCLCLIGSPCFGAEAFDSLETRLAAAIERAATAKVELAAARKPATPTEPALRITFWATRPCPAGEKAEREIVSHLADEGWRAGKHYAIERSDDADGCPQFSFRGARFSEDGYPGWLEWRRRLADVMGVPLPAVRGNAVASGSGSPLASRATGAVAGAHTPSAAAPVSSHGIPLAPGERLVAIDGVPVNQAPPQELAPRAMEWTRQVRSDMHTHVCRNCGHSWSHPDGSTHPGAHICSNCGRRETRIASHSVAMNVPVPRQPSYPMQPMRMSPCANGMCFRR